MNLPLTKLSETEMKITLGWTPVPGAIGYRFQSSAQAPKWSHTWDPNRSQVTFSKADEYRVEALGVEAAGEFPVDEPTPPVGAHWYQNFSDGDQTFADFDTHDANLGRTISDPIHGQTRGCTNVPIASPVSPRSCRVVCSEQFASTSSTGDKTELWAPQAYSAPWFQRGAKTWFRTVFLIPDGTDPRYPGKLVPNPGDGVSGKWHTFEEWHKKDPDAPGPTSPKIWIQWGQGGNYPSLARMVIGGLNAQIREWRLYITDQVQTKANGPYADPDDGPPIGGTAERLKFNHWYDCLDYIEFDPDPTKGYLECYVDGKLRIRDNFPTMAHRSGSTTPGMSNDMGIYRDDDEGRSHGNETIYVGLMAIGPTRASVGA